MLHCVTQHLSTLHCYTALHCYALLLCVTLRCTVVHCVTVRVVSMIVTDLGGCITLCYAARADGRKVPPSPPPCAGITIPRPLPSCELFKFFVLCYAVTPYNMFLHPTPFTCSLPLPLPLPLPTPHPFPRSGKPLRPSCKPSCEELGQQDVNSLFKTGQTNCSLLPASRPQLTRPSHVSLRRRTEGRGWGQSLHSNRKQRH